MVADDTNLAQHPKRHVQGIESVGAEGEVIVGAADLEFIVDRGLPALGRRAAGCGATIVSRPAAAVVTRLPEPSRAEGHP